MRTGELALLAPLCSDVACDSAPCQLSAHWPIAWTVGPSEPPADCSADCSVLLALPAADFADDELDCETSPSSPSLLMRTGALLLLAQHCVESADEPADCSLVAFWSTSCTVGPPEPPANCPAACAVAFRLPATDLASELLDWSTEPPSPGEPMRTG